MEHRKLYLQSIRALPIEYIDGKTLITVRDNNVFSANPALAPLCYSNGKWSEIVIDQKDSQ